MESQKGRDPDFIARPARPSAPAKKRHPKMNLAKSWRPIAVVLVLVLLVYLAYGYIHTKNQLTKLSNPKTATLSQTQQLVDAVGKLVQLPGGETPTIATVNNASKLKNQAFFANAQDGDKVMIYSKANRAILYRPSTNRVIEYSTVNLAGSSSQ